MENDIGYFLLQKNYLKCVKMTFFEKNIKKTLSHEKNKKIINMPVIKFSFK